MILIAGVLCVGDVRGVIKIYNLKWQEDELSCVSSADLWPHSDRIQVTKLCTIPSNNSEIIVIATKGSFVIAIALDAEYSVMRTKPYHVGNLSINGESIIQMFIKNALLSWKIGIVNIQVYNFQFS